MPAPRRRSFWVWLKDGAADYRRHFGSKEFLRNNFNITCIGGVISVIDQIWINGKMTMPEVMRSRLIATIVDLAGAGDASVSGHGEWLRLLKITPESPDWKRRAAEWPVLVLGVAAWNSVQYILSGVAASHYFRSVVISTVIGVGVQVLVLRANAILNNYATNDPKHCQSLSTRWSRAFGCDKLSTATKRRIYWIAIVAMNTFMFANWIWGKGLRRAIFGH